MTRRDPPHDPEAVYTLRLVFSERARGTLRAANAAWAQNTKVTVSTARILVQQYGATAELLESDGHMRWVIGRGGALRAKRRPGAGGKPKSPSGPALAHVHVRVTKEHHAAIVAACQRAGCTITQAVEALPDLLLLLSEVTNTPFPWDNKPRAPNSMPAPVMPTMHRCQTCGWTTGGPFVHDDREGRRCTGPYAPCACHPTTP